MKKNKENELKNEVKESKLSLILSFTILMILCSCGGYYFGKTMYSDKAYKGKENIVSDVDCHFTKTFKVVEILKDTAAVPEITHIILDSFQNFSPFVMAISTETANELEVGSNYEFTFYLNDNYDNMTDIINDSNVNLKVMKTDKVGLEQIQEDICK